MSAVAISNNDMVYLHWNVAEKIPDCLGFSVIRHDAKTGSRQPVPAMVGFSSTPAKAAGVNKAAGKTFETTDIWPVQKYSWKDLFAKRGGTYWYEIVPMLGKPGSLKPDAGRTMRTNSVTVDSHHGDCSVYFNRGIISTQAIAHSLPKGKGGKPSTEFLKTEIAKPDSPLRKRLVGDLETGVLSLLERAKSEPGGTCYCALYELSDQDLVDHLASLKKKVHIVLSNAGDDTEDGSKDGDSTNVEARKKLHKLKLDIKDRMLIKGHIGHNKFVVYANKKGPQAVLSGSTNWTPTGLCAQSNNAIVIESPELAKQYLAYWKILQADTVKAKKDRSKLQDKGFRAANKKEKPDQDLEDSADKPGGTVRVWFSPNTVQKSVPRSKKPGVKPPTPADLTEVFGLIENAKQGALFLAFIPGNPSIVSKLKEVYDAKTKGGKLFYLRGAATSPDPASVFRVDLYHRSATSDATVRAVDNPPQLRSKASVASVAGIFASFAKWEAEIYKVGHAVIHDKILVIDPFTDNSVVVTGSHNLGFRASYNNDENLLIIRGNREVAEAYAAHVLDVYEHYRWRWKLQEPLRDALEKLKKQKPDAKSAELWKEVMQKVAPTVIDKAWKNLNPSDKWQDFYVKNKDFLAAETNFWSSFGGEGVARGTRRDPARDNR
ncbi:phospholipase D-like domain-containing protein [Bradyrhizobium prioriisuperbiae]|uniref:phospholipase D-like domain-containing protein n=1 Tax=Bradyrhizobium prioriisuperbiae TaxID=2854389 RepID=UPI0028E525DC|nr:phospholipase D-like domain-containing protein [Bradyrhizobium prioritasuperba]